MTARFYFFSLFCFVFLNFEKPSVPRLARKGKDYALFFAVNKYQSPKLTPLQNPIGDAKRIAQELQSSYGFQTEVVENPTYDLIRNTLHEYSRNFATNRFDTEGQLLIFFSGHGRNEANAGYFFPSDVNPEDIERSGFSYNNWRGKIDVMPCKHILVAIDACYSGSFDPKFGMKTDGLFGTRAGELTEGQRLIAEHNKHKTRLFLTSGESDQPTPDKSDFAKKFLAALLTKGYDDGVLTSSEMFSNHLENATPRPRTGEFGCDEAGSSFIFVAQNIQNPERVSNLTTERQEWEKIKSLGSIYAFEEFKKRFPKSDFTLLADTELFKLRNLKADNEWQLIRNSTNIDDFINFKKQYPNSSLQPLAENKIIELQKKEEIIKGNEPQKRYGEQKSSLLDRLFNSNNSTSKPLEKKKKRYKN